MLAVSQYWFLIAPCLATAHGGVVICDLEMKGMKGSQMKEHPKAQDGRALLAVR